MATTTQEIQILIDGCLKNDRQSQRALYEQYAPAMLGVCMRYCNSREKAEDVMIEGFVDVFKNLSSFRNECSLQSWIHSIMVHKAISDYRSQKKHLLNESLDDDTVQIQAPSSSGEDILTKMEAKQILETVAQMPEDWRVIFNLRLVEEYSFKEIAEQLGRNENTVRVYFQRARNWLIERTKIKNQNNLTTTDY